MPSNLTVIGLGLGTVFFGLIALIAICYIMGAVCGIFAKNNKSEDVKPQTTTPAAPIANKQEIVAACCAVIAEELGTEANNIKVLSFKRV